MFRPNVRRLFVRVATVLLVLAVASVLRSSNVRAQSGVTATAVVGLNIRGGPSSSFEKLGVLLPGESVALNGRARGWYRFTFQEPGTGVQVYGWVVGGAEGLTILGDIASLPVVGDDPQFVVVSTPPPGEAPAGSASSVIAIVPAPSNAVIGTAVGFVVIRGGPGAQYERLGVLAPGQSIVLDGRTGGWFRFSYPNSLVKGWLSGTVIKISGDYTSLPSVTYPPEGATLTR